MWTKEPPLRFRPVPDSSSIARKEAMEFFSGFARVCIGKTLLPIQAIFLYCGLSAAQAHPPKYDPATETTETKRKGVLEELRLPPKGQEKEVVHLLIKNGNDMLDIYLCPKSFIDDMGVTFSKGDAISVTGSKVNKRVRT